ncbi:MAG: biopolymer transporter ExbD [Bacteroidales bacterium]|nr:biopolymer transporter ExbD [Bacteroidales bacterium]
MARKKRKVEEVNSSSTADIAFLLLIFFLLTTSMDTDKGLARRLPPPIPKDQKEQDVDIKKRNLLPILVNSQNQILAGSDFIEIGQLRERVKEFVLNANDDPHMPEKIEEDIPFFGKMMITKNHVISLMNDVGTEYQAYISVQNELVGAYNELRNDLSKSKFGKSFDQLGEEEQKAVMKVYPMKISEAEPKNYGGK